ncbi:hypothetical protein BD324DRAFT_653085 [Kockovaella imperatae]|uniref:RRM domain-containing protein n=1 Tax=Kockovaella imperatae TaxID=4999 RepID=A0A1Y1U9X3_9TREE|nr:hypothetical protein BD324DRAFT_653085 [Kockovaella imperatae]ORX34829.1 hypothetical protein BD324DRAFT_653085 [Kockovaella imperatae]
MNHHSGSQSPPLPNLHTLSISPYPSAQSAGVHDYRYNGVFGPPGQGMMPTSAGSSGGGGGGGGGGWSPNKRGSRSGLPTSWYDVPSSRESPIPHSTFDPYRRGDASSPPVPALSPPSSTQSGPTSSSNIYQPYPQPMPQSYPPDPSSYASMAVTPSPPPLSSSSQLGIPSLNHMQPMGGFGLSGSGSPSTLAGPNAGYMNVMPPFGSQNIVPPQPQQPSRSNGVWSSRNGFGLPMPEDDVIPTAIVIKNIPFAVPRESLLGVMESLGAPLPYAFNYHHDNGVFRGLAFANFRAPDEAAAVVAALNGYDVQGRKLRVEYKKVLQPGEKDKIEREKALKRMRSIQFDSKDMPPPLNIPSTHRANGRHSADIEPQYSPPHSAASSGNSSDLPVALDLNDPSALDIYSRVLVFKEDRMRDELAFSRSLTPTERRIVHLVAQKLGLLSVTRGSEGETKYVVVTRDPLPRPPFASSSSATVTSSAYLSPYSSTNQESLSPSLRIKKSMPDLRGFNGPVVARDPARSLTPQRSSGNLRGGMNGGGYGDAGSREYVSMGAAAGRRINGMGSGLGSGTFNSFFGSPIDSIPPVPPLPAGLGLSTSSSGGASGGGGGGGGIGSASHSPNPLASPTANMTLHHSKSSLSAMSANGINGTGGGMYGSSGISITSGSPDSQDLSNAAPLRNPRGPAGEGRGFGGLRGSASGILKGSNGMIMNGSASTNSGGGGGELSTHGHSHGHGHGHANGLGPIGSKRVYEDLDQDSAGGGGMGQDDGVEMARTRESLDL